MAGRSEGFLGKGDVCSVHFWSDYLRFGRFFGNFADVRELSGTFGCCVVC